MAGIRAIYLRDEKAALTQALQADRDVTAALSAVRGCMERVKQNYIAAEDDTAMRHQAVMLFSIAGSAVASVQAARDTRIQILLPKEAAQTGGAARAKRASAMLVYVPVALSLLILAVLIAMGNTASIVLGIASLAACGALTAAYLRRIGETPPPAAMQVPEASADVLVDTREMEQAVDRIFLEMDRTLERYAKESHDQTIKLAWSEDQLAAVQVLWEAMEEQESTYALKAIPNLLNALSRKGVRFVTYRPDTAEFFEDIPGEGTLRTIRPAMFFGEALLLRGQITGYIDRRQGGA